MQIDASLKMRFTFSIICENFEVSFFLQNLLLHMHSECKTESYQKDRVDLLYGEAKSAVILWWQYYFIILTSVLSQYTCQCLKVSIKWCLLHDNSYDYNVYLTCIYQYSAIAEHAQYNVVEWTCFEIGMAAIIVGSTA